MRANIVVAFRMKLMMVMECLEFWVPTSVDHVTEICHRGLRLKANGKLRYLPVEGEGHSIVVVDAGSGV